MSGFGNGFLAGAAVSVLLVIGACGLSINVATDPDSDVTLPRLKRLQIDKGPLAGSVVMRYVGAISPSGVALAEERLKELPQDRPIWLAMSSGGGDVKAAQSLTQYTNKAGIGLVVPGNAECASACVMMFAAADRRVAFPDSYFGFHYGIRRGLLFNFGPLTGVWEKTIPMTEHLDPLTSKIPDRKRSLAAFFEGCSEGNPTLRRKVNFLSWKQINSIVQDDSRHIDCDEVAGQDNTWLAEQIAPLREVEEEAAGQHSEDSR